MSKLNNLLLLAILLISSVFGDGNEVNIVYSGSSLGAYGPCGCPGNPTGGLPRMANFIKEFRTKKGSIVLIDAGNFSSRTGREKAVLTSYFMRGMGLLQYDAVLVGEAELEYGIKRVLEMNSAAKLPLVSANILDSNGKRVFHPFRHLKAGESKVKLLVVGLTSNHGLTEIDDNAGYRITDPVSALKDIVSSEKKKGGYIVVVTDLRDSALASIVNSSIKIDFIIVSSDYAYKEVPTTINGIRIVSSFPETRNIGVVSFSVSSGLINAASGYNEPMTSKYDRNSEIDTLFKEYERSLSSVKFKYPRPNDAQKLFAGQESCKECHARINLKEVSGPHVRAFETLIKSGNEYNPSCLKCHVTGYERENGFWDVESSMDMAGVQCEGCHGPLVGHVAEERKRAFGSIDFIRGSSGNNPDTRRNRPIKVGMHKCSYCHNGKFVLSKPVEEAWKAIGH